MVKNFDYIRNRGIDYVHDLGWMDVEQRCIYFQNISIDKCIHGWTIDYLPNYVLIALEGNDYDTQTYGMKIHLPFPKREFSI